MDLSEPRDIMLLGALSVGIVFGVTARLSGFCLRSAIIEVLDRRAGRQTASWLAALAFAIGATQAMEHLEIVGLAESIYLGENIAWLAIAVGGFAFGLGMVLTRGCGGRHLVLAAGGNLRSWIVILVLGLTAYATLRGILALPRTWLEGLAAVSPTEGASSLSQWAAEATGAASDTAALGVTAALVLMLAAAMVRVAARTGYAAAAPGIVIGLTIATGWYVTGVLGFDDFDPIRLESITFTAPVGNAIQYLMTYTGSQADFGVTVVAGTLIGAFFAAIARRELSLSGFDTPGHLVRYVAGAALMGFGGVLALGCTIGAGLSGVSALSIGSFLALASIIAGGALGHKVKTGVVGGRAPETVPAE